VPLALDPFAVIMTVLVGGMLLFLIALGIFVPGSGAKQLDWKPTRSAEVEVQNEIDDLDQMLEAANARRRRRGAAELTEESLHAQVREHTHEQSRRRDEYMADLEVAQMLDATNAKRRDRGEPELSLEQLRAELGL
jgi:antitoxin component of MazEF toxin-antitoxin module